MCRSMYDMKETYLYTLFQAHWDRSEQRNHQTQNYLVKDIIYISEHEIKGPG